MKPAPARLAASLTLALALTSLAFSTPCLGQDTNAPVATVPAPTQNKTYAQLVSDLEEILERPVAKNGGFSYSATLGPQGGLGISKFNNSELSWKFSPITRGNLLDAYSSPSTWTDDAGVQHTGWAVSISLKEPLSLILPDATGEVSPTETAPILLFSAPEEAQAAVEILKAIQNCTTADIDWKFLEGREGRKLDGYVPKRNGIPLGKSGVTIGTGIDLGQYSQDEINNWSIASDLKTRLLPYAFPLQGLDADLVANQLHITSDESDQLDAAIRQKKTSRLTKRYDAATLGASFVELPIQAQTVLFSVAYQFGDIATVNPRLWADVINQEWEAAAAHLRDFNGNGQPSTYQNRRELEAKLLDQLKPNDVSP